PTAASAKTFNYFLFTALRSWRSPKARHRPSPQSRDFFNYRMKPQGAIYRRLFVLDYLLKVAAPTNQQSALGSLPPKFHVELSVCLAKPQSIFICNFLPKMGSFVSRLLEHRF